MCATLSGNHQRTQRIDGKMTFSEMARFLVVLAAKRAIGSQRMQRSTKPCPYIAMHEISELHFDHSNNYEPHFPMHVGGGVDMFSNLLPPQEALTPTKHTNTQWSNFKGM